MIYAVADRLLTQADLSGTDVELPDAGSMLTPLLVNQPVLVNGQLLPADDPGHCCSWKLW